MPMAIDLVDFDYVSMWLVENMETQTDDIAFLTSYLFVVGREELIGLLGEAGAKKAQLRINELYAWMHCRCVDDIGKAQLDVLLDDIGTKNTTFGISDAARALHYLRHFAYPETETHRLCVETLRAKLVPHLQDFIRLSLSTSVRQFSFTSDNSNLSLSLAVVNTVTLFLRTLGLLSIQDLKQALGLLRQMYIEEDCGGLSMYNKACVFAHVLLNVQGHCSIKDVSWVFDWLDMWQPLLQAVFQDFSNPHRAMCLDLFAEVITGYRYFNYWTPSRMRYEWFVAAETKRKYVDRSDHVYRYYAHPDFPSDHEALSLYHMTIASR